MNKTGLLLPPAFLLLGFAIGHSLPPAAVSGKSPPSVPAIPAAPATPAPAARLTQPILADWQDFLQTLENATLADLPALWDSLPLPEREPPTTPGTSARHRMLIESWAELDPAGALAIIKEKAPDEIFLTMIVFQTWAQQDPEAALNALHDEPDTSIQNYGVAGFLLSFKENPTQLIQWAKHFTWMDASKLEEWDFTSTCPDDLLNRLLAADRPGLYEIATQLPPWFLLRLKALTFLQQATTDPPAALASLKDRRLTKDEAVKMAENLGSLAQSHPASAIAILDALSAASDGTPLITNSSEKIAGPLVKYLAASDPAAAAAFIAKHLEPNAKFGLVEKTYQDLFASNPAAALIVGQALPPFPLEMVTLPTFKDRQTALEILPNAPPSWRRDRALQTTLDQWQRESPAEAQAWMEALPPGEWRDRAAAILSAKDLNQNLVSLQLQEITLRHHAAQTPAELKEVEQISNMAAQTDPAGTLAILGNWPPSPARQSALEQTAILAAGQSTSKALERSLQIPDPNASAEAIRGVVKVWTENGPLAASAWLSNLAPGPMREAAVDRFAETIAALDPAASLAWATTLEDPAARSARLETTYRKWATDDPARAAAALAEIPGLRPADLQQLRTPPAPAAK